MLRHTLLLIYRNFKRFKTTFFINLIGLSTGLACTLLIYLWVSDELSVDKFHTKDDQLYQVMKHNVESLGIETDEDTPGLLARALVEEMPEVESSVSVFPPAAHTFIGVLSLENHHTKAMSKFADEDFFKIFSYRLIHGAEDQVLADKFSVVISKEVAAKLFQTTDNAVGKTLEWKGERGSGQFVVSGVFETTPVNSSIQFDIVFSYHLLLETFPNFLNWGGSGPSTYVILKKGTKVSEFSNKIAGFVKSKYKESSLTLFARPYSDRYLYGDYENGIHVGGRIEYVRIFSLIAIFILLIACVNFMNLSTAKASRRIKEVGIKKAIGATRKVLILQYIGESMLMTFLSLVLAILIADLLLPYFNLITGKHLSLDLNTRLIVSLGILTLLTGLIAGSYPALYLSAFNTTEILRSSFSQVRNKTFIGELSARNALVIFQFAISIVLIVSVVVVYMQMQFIQSKNLGFSRDNIISFPVEGKIADDPEAFLQEIKKIPGIINASYMDGDLTGMHSGTTGVEWEGKIPDEIVDFELLGVGYDLIETLGVEIKQGRSFSRSRGSEISMVIFNEAAIESMGLIDPVGRPIKLWGEEKQIIGVVKNFHFESLYEDVKPLIFRLSTRRNQNVFTKIKAGTEQQTLAQLGKFYQQYNLGIPFEYKFLDEDYQNLYVSENRVGILSRYFATLAILISCLGLFGLAAFTAERRIKEIGIRKVLGSSELGIVYLLSRDFTKTVFTAVIIGLPVSYYLTRYWLNNFAYRIGLEWWYFIGAGLLALLIGWLTVGLQTVNAARLNPTKCLRDE